MSSRKIKRLEDKLLPESKRCSKNGTFSDSDCTRGDHEGSVIQQSSLSLTSKTSAEQNFETTSTSSDHASCTVVFGGDRKCSEVSRHTSNGIASRQPMLSNSDIYSKTGLPSCNRNYELPTCRTQRNHLNAGDDSSNTTTHDAQHRTESSCSNSSVVIHPVTELNHSFQRASKEIYSVIFNSRVPHSRIEEPVTGSLKSDLSSKGVHEASNDLRNRVSMEMMSGNSDSLPSKQINANLQKQDLSLEQAGRDCYEQGLGPVAPRDGEGRVERKTDNYRLALRNNSSSEGHYCGVVNRSLICSGSSDQSNCSAKIDDNIGSCNDNDENGSFLSGKLLVGPEISVDGAKGKSIEMVSKVIDENSGGLYRNESSEVIKKPTDTGMKVLFDLNEDINVNELDDFGHSVSETENDENAIRVIAKAGVPLGFPMIPLKFEGGLGWKGPAATSAFHPAGSKISTSSPVLNTTGTKDQKRITEIDLNINALEDNPTIEFPKKHIGISSASPFEHSYSEASSKQVERLSIDLNSLCDDANDFVPSSVPGTSAKSSVVNLDENVATSVGNNQFVACRPGEAGQSLGNKALDSTVHRAQDCNFVGVPCWPNLNPLQVSNPAHVRSYLSAMPNFLPPMEQMQRVASLQQKLPYGVHFLSSQNYPLNNSFYIGPIESLPTSIPYTNAARYAGYPHENANFGRLLNPGRVPTYYSPPHFMEPALNGSTGDMKNTEPNISVKNEDESSPIASRMDRTRQLFPAKSSYNDESMVSREQQGLSMKRKEPEVGWDFHQLGYRQET